MAAASSLSINGSGGLEFRADGRFGGGISLVGEGIGFLERARISIHSYYQAVHEAQEAKFGEKHRLRIGVSAYLAPRLIDSSVPSNCPCITISHTRFSPPTRLRFFHCCNIIRLTSR
jgi:hypothetical protein